MTVLTAKNIAMARGASVLFQGLEIRVEAGSVVAVIGPNGAGKSTLLMALAGMLDALAGEAVLQGRPVKEYARSELARLIAWQGELPPTEFGLTVIQRLQLAAMGESDDLMQRAVQVMDVASLLPRNLAELSSGERQRVEIAAVMVRDCPLWLFDEPTSHLDLRHQVRCLQMFRDEAKKGRAIVTVLHDIQQAVAVADQMILIDGRGGIECGSVQAMMVSEKLESLFGVKLATVTLGGERVHLPDYRNDTGAAGESER